MKLSQLRGHANALKASGQPLTQGDFAVLNIADKYNRRLTQSYKAVRRLPEGPDRDKVARFIATYLNREFMGAQPEDIDIPEFTGKPVVASEQVVRNLPTAQDPQQMLARSMAEYEPNAVGTESHVELLGNFAKRIGSAILQAMMTSGAGEKDPAMLGQHIAGAIQGEQPRPIAEELEHMGHAMEAFELLDLLYAPTQMVAGGTYGLGKGIAEGKGVMGTISEAQKDALLAAQLQLLAQSPEEAAQVARAAGLPQPMQGTKAAMPSDYAGIEGPGAAAAYNIGVDVLNADLPALVTRGILNLINKSRNAAMLNKLKAGMEAMRAADAAKNAATHAADAEFIRNYRPAKGALPEPDLRKGIPLPEKMPRQPDMAVPVNDITPLRTERPVRLTQEEIVKLRAERERLKQFLGPDEAQHANVLDEVKPEEAYIYRSRMAGQRSKGNAATQSEMDYLRELAEAKYDTTAVPVNEITPAKSGQVDQYHARRQKRAEDAAEAARSKRAAEARLREVEAQLVEQQRLYDAFTTEYAPTPQARPVARGGALPEPSTADVRRAKLEELKAKATMMGQSSAEGTNENRRYVPSREDWAATVDEALPKAARPSVEAPARGDIRDIPAETGARAGEAQAPVQAVAKPPVKKPKTSKARKQQLTPSANDDRTHPPVTEWEMTSGEYRDSHRSGDYNEVRDKHRRIVWDALYRGDPVPRIVVREYPDIEREVFLAKARERWWKWRDAHPGGMHRMTLDELYEGQGLAIDAREPDWMERSDSFKQYVDAQMPRFQDSIKAGTVKGQLDPYHRAAIVRAIDKGYPIPRRVLNEWPDLYDEAVRRGANIEREDADEYLSNKQAPSSTETREPIAAAKEQSAPTAFEAKLKDKLDKAQAAGKTVDKQKLSPKLREAVEKVEDNKAAEATQTPAAPKPAPAPKAGTDAVAKADAALEEAAAQVARFKEELKREAAHRKDLERRLKNKHSQKQHDELERLRTESFFREDELTEARNKARKKRDAARRAREAAIMEMAMASDEPVLQAIGRHRAGKGYFEEVDAAMRAFVDSELPGGDADVLEGLATFLARLSEPFTGDQRYMTKLKSYTHQVYKNAMDSVKALEVEFDTVSPYRRVQLGRGEPSYIVAKEMSQEYQAKKAAKEAAAKSLHVEKVKQALKNVRFKSTKYSMMRYDGPVEVTGSVYRGLGVRKSSWSPHKDRRWAVDHVKSGLFAGHYATRDEARAAAYQLAEEMNLGELSAEDIKKAPTDQRNRMREIAKDPYSPPSARNPESGQVYIPSMADIKDAAKRLNAFIGAAPENAYNWLPVWARQASPIRLGVEDRLADTVARGARAAEGDSIYTRRSLLDYVLNQGKNPKLVRDMFRNAEIRTNFPLLAQELINGTERQALIIEAANKFLDDPVSLMGLSDEIADIYMASLTVAQMGGEKTRELLVSQGLFKTFSGGKFTRGQMRDYADKFLAELIKANAEVKAKGRNHVSKWAESVLHKAEALSDQLTNPGVARVVETFAENAFWPDEALRIHDLEKGKSYYPVQMVYQHGGFKVRWGKEGLGHYMAENAMDAYKQMYEQLNRQHGRRVYEMPPTSRMMSRFMEEVINAPMTAEKIISEAWKYPDAMATGAIRFLPATATNRKALFGVARMARQIGGRFAKTDDSLFWKAWQEIDRAGVISTLAGAYKVPLGKYGDLSLTSTKNMVGNLFLSSLRSEVYRVGFKKWLGYVRDGAALINHESRTAEAQAAFDYLMRRNALSGIGSMFKGQQVTKMLPWWDYRRWQNITGLPEYVAERTLAQFDIRRPSSWTSNAQGLAVNDAISRYAMFRTILQDMGHSSAATAPDKVLNEALKKTDEALLLLHKYSPFVGNVVSGFRYVTWPGAFFEYVMKNALKNKKLAAAILLTIGALTVGRDKESLPSFDDMTDTSDGLSADWWVKIAKDTAIDIGSLNPLMHTFDIVKPHGHVVQATKDLFDSFAADEDLRASEERKNALRNALKVFDLGYSGVYSAIEAGQTAYEKGDAKQLIRAVRSLNDVIRTSKDLNTGHERRAALKVGLALLGIGVRDPQSGAKRAIDDLVRKFKYTLNDDEREFIQEMQEWLSNE